MQRCGTHKKWRALTSGGEHKRKAVVRGMANSCAMLLGSLNRCHSTPTFCVTWHLRVVHLPQLTNNFWQAPAEQLPYSPFLQHLPQRRAHANRAAFIDLKPGRTMQQTQPTRASAMGRLVVGAEAGERTAGIGSATCQGPQGTAAFMRMQRMMLRCWCSDCMCMHLPT